jgi:enoyl-CoA hydratase/carnithine racemase
MAQLVVETVGHVRVLRLDRPESKNALTSSEAVQAIIEKRAPRFHGR